MKPETGKLLEKADRALHAAEALLREGFDDIAAGRAYHAMFHTAQAILWERGIRHRKHAGVHAAFGEHFAKTGILDPMDHRWLLDSFDERLLGDYGMDAELDAEGVALRIEQGREFLEAARRLLGG